MDRAPEKRRGRPRAFDPDEALARARDTFLRHGYAGASIEELTRAMGLSKPSLYAAFGDKRALFQRVLAARIAELGRRYRAAFKRGGSLEAALAAVFEEAVAINLVEGGPCGCLIGSPAVTEAGVDEALARFTREYFALCDRELGRWFDDAWAPQTLRGPALGRMISAVIHDLALRARIGESRARLRAFASEAAAALARAAA